MIIILERIPKTTNKSDIENFLSPAVKGKIFQKPGKIEEIKISILKNTKNHLLDHYGLVFIDSDEAAVRTIKKLNRKVFNGKHISVREYHHRSWQNDRRINSLKWDNNLISKRKSDRRQFNLKVRKSHAVSFSSEDSFHRKF